MIALRPARSSGRGITLLELIVALALIGLLAAASLPALSNLVRKTVMDAATTDVALVFTLARDRAIRSGRMTGVKWFSKGGDVVLTVYEDENGNGVLTADIKAGIDRLVAGPFWMRGKYPHVTFSFLPNFKGLDPSGSPIGDLNDPIRFGRSDICSFAPDANASPGSVYLADGVERQSVVRVSPANGKIQVFDWQPGKKKWVRRL
ncbi:MAG: prepilin-type N-terminal cleavage/methylation domain-containing protein [Acidithiobacillales bacterium]